MRLSEQSIFRLFEVGLLLKGVNAIIEIVAGLALSWSGAKNDFISTLITNELIEDPNDFLATRLDHLLPTLTPHAQLWSGLYLLSHGLVKGVLILGLARNQRWAYPAILIFLGSLVVYQFIKFTLTHSAPLLLLTLFDIIFMLLIWHEYRLRRRLCDTP